jgi:hypothetical protein
VIAVGGLWSRRMKTIEKDRDPLCVGFYCFLAQPKKFRNPGGSVFIGVFLLLFTYTLRSVFTTSFPSRRERRGIAILKNTPLLYIDSAAWFATACKCDCRRGVANRVEGWLHRNRDCTRRHARAQRVSNTNSR